MEHTISAIKWEFVESVEPNSNTLLISADMTKILKEPGIYTIIFNAIPPATPSDYADTANIREHWGAGSYSIVWNGPSKS